MASVPSAARSNISRVQASIPRSTTSAMVSTGIRLSTQKSIQSFGLRPLREPMWAMFSPLQFGSSSAFGGPEALVISLPPQSTAASR